MADEIGLAMQKVGGSAASAGLEYAKLSSWIALVSSKTRESAESIGESFKSILARFQNLTISGFDEEDNTSINNVAIALDSVGVALTDSTGNFRDFGIIIDELGAKWNTLDSRTKAFLGTQLAGTRQQSRFLNLMNGYEESLGLYEGALNSAGTTQQKYNQYLQSTEAHLNRLTTAGTGVWQKVFDSTAIQNGIDLLTSVVSGFSSLVDVTGILPPVVFIATAALFAFNTELNKIANKSIASGLGMVAAGFKAVGSSAQGAVVSIASFAGKFIIPIAIFTALSFGVQKLTEAYTKNKQAQDELKQKQQQTTQAYIDHGDKIESLVSKYKELSTATSLTDDQHKELQSVQNELNKLIPDFTANVDEQGNAHLRTAEDINVEIGRLRELKQAQDDLFLTRDYPKQYASLVNQASKMDNQISGILSKLSNGEQQMFSDPESGAISFETMPVSADKSRELRAELTLLQQQRDGIGDQIDSLRKRYTDITYDEGISPSQATPLFKPTPTNTTRGTPSGDGDKKDFSETITTWQIQLDALNNQLDITKQKVQDATTVEDKQSAYDAMISAYTAKREFVQKLYQYANDEEWTLRQQLEAKVKAGQLSQETLDKITSGDVASLTFLDEKMANLVKAWQDARQQRLDYKKQGIDINSEMAQEEKALQEQINKIREDNYSTWLKTVTDIADQVVEAYKDMYRQELDIEEERHKKAIDNLDTELDKYEEVVNAKLKLLDRQDDTESYDKQLAKAQTERNATASQITVLSRDNSMETQAKVAELKKKLAEQDEAIEETKAKRSKDLQKQSLQDGLDVYKKDVEGKKTAETIKYESEKNRINAIIADEQRWSGVRQAILSGDQKKIQQVTTDLQSGITTFTTAMGNSLDKLVNVNLQNVITKIQEAYKALQNAPNITPPAPVKSIRDYVGNRSTVDWDASSGNVKVGNKTLSPAQLLNAGLTFDNGTWKGAIDKLKSLLGFETGGYTGAFDGGKLGILHQKELILNRGDTSNILAAVNMVRNLMPKLNQSSLAGVGPTIGKLEMNFNGFSGSKRDADDVFTKTVGGLRKLGVNI